MTGGAQPRAAVLAALRAADLFVLPSRVARNGDRDGLPNVLMEAQSQRLPVVASRVAGIPELVRDGETGLLVTPGEEAWKTKEAKVGEGIPAQWGDWRARAIHWETLTATTLIEAGADVVVLRHPESLQRVQRTVAALMAQQPEAVMA